MPSLNVVIVEKNGEVKGSKIKEYAESELYKKAGYKSAEGFKQQTSWAVEIEGVQYKVALYAKTTGKAGSENKYDFPPPVDSTLFFGACVLVGSRNGVLADLTVEQWTKFYEFLFGGFEDLGDEDSEEEMDTDDEIAEMESELGAKLNVPVKIQTTKQGYIKDDFIVDDDDEIEEEEAINESESEESYVPPPPKKRTINKAKNNVPIETAPAKKQTRQRKAKKTEPEPEQIVGADQAEDKYLDCSSELTYEEYVK